MPIQSLTSCCPKVSQALKSHPIGKILIVSALALMIIAALATVNMGLLSQLSDTASLSLRIAAWSTAGLTLFTGGLLHLKSSHHTPIETQQSSHSPSPTGSEDPVSSSKQVSSESPQPSSSGASFDTTFGSKGLAIVQDPKVYSRKGLTAKEKMDKQLAFAIEEGKKGQKRIAEAKFTPVFKTEDPKNELQLLLEKKLPPKKLQEELAKLHLTPESLLQTVRPPVREQFTIEIYPQKNDSIIYFAHTQGKRDGDEDDYGLFINGSMQFIGVYDGHGDHKQAATFVKERLPQKINQYLKKLKFITDDIIANAITRAIHELDAEYKQSGGTNACCALMIGNAIYLINVGDSRAILVTKDTEYQLTEDANPKNERFTKKMDPEKVYVAPNGRIFALQPNNAREKKANGLNVAREIGVDYLSPRPKITKITFDQSDDKSLLSFQHGNYLVLACDGLWDVATTQEVSEAIRQMEKDGKSLKEMSEALVRGAYKAGSGDNITVAVMRI